MNYICCKKYVNSIGCPNVVFVLAKIFWIETKKKGNKNKKGIKWEILLISTAVSLSSTEINISRKENLSPLCPQVHNPGNNHLFPYKRELARPGYEVYFFLLN